MTTIVEDNHSAFRQVAKVLFVGLGLATIVGCSGKFGGRDAYWKEIPVLREQKTPDGKKELVDTGRTKGLILCDQGLGNRGALAIERELLVEIQRKKEIDAVIAYAKQHHVRMFVRHYTDCDGKARTVFLPPAPGSNGAYAEHHVKDCKTGKRVVHRVTTPAYDEKEEPSIGSPKQSESEWTRVYSRTMVYQSPSGLEIIVPIFGGVIRDGVNNLVPWALWRNVSGNGGGNSNYIEGDTNTLQQDQNQQQWQDQWQQQKQKMQQWQKNQPNRQPGRQDCRQQHRRGHNGNDCRQ